MAISLVVVYVVLALLALLLIYAGAQFLKELPAYTQQAQQMVAQWQATLQGLGLASAGSAAVAGQADLSKPLNWIADLLAALGSAIGSFTTLILLTTFLFVDIVLWPGRLEETARRGHGYARRLSGVHRRSAPVHRGHGDRRNLHRRAEHGHVLSVRRALRRCCGACSPAS
ncbi:MAG: hypothetical protein V9H69_17970 [Anaerolineae bacterium]